MLLPIPPTPGAEDMGAAAPALVPVPAPVQAADVPAAARRMATEKRNNAKNTIRQDGVFCVD